ncbi:winged helix-turn-helix domain-containing protein [Haloarchaeobius amylolyticus]|uniref:winged helix-turn-helix domain-containing protein n=1 Tax=Haloarchaeobius amylolyticus TaxID=1198296 RepID=UPI0022711859|nr:winged helix-turn-helix domain-containing protein [Haloarchaeobius amylolyticus]
MPKEGQEGATAVRPEEAFSLLGNETRFAILRALWEFFDPPDSSPVSYSDLMDAVGVRDSGNFNYHLGKLEGHFVESTDDGYVLTAAGEQIVQTVVAGTAVDQTSMEAVHVGVVCPVCGGTETTIEYDDETLTVQCHTCDGLFPSPPGKLAEFQLPPAGLAGREPEAIFRSAIAHVTLETRSMIAGVCPRCASEPTVDVEWCPEHDDRRDRCEVPGCTCSPIVEYLCQRCKHIWRFPTWCNVLWHPATIALFHEQDVDIEPLSWNYYARGREFDQTVHDTDPPRLSVTVGAEDAALEFTFDETMSVLSVERTDAEH